MAKLIDYLPEFLQSISDFQMVAKGEQPEFDMAASRIKDAKDDFYFETLTQDGIDRWESILHIQPKGTETTDERRFRIQSRLYEHPPFSFLMLCSLLGNLCGEDGYKAEVISSTFTLIVRVALAARSNMVEVEQMLERIVPANMIVDLSLMYNRHFQLRPYTYGELRPFTHYRLRNDEEIANNVTN